MYYSLDIPKDHNRSLSILQLAKAKINDIKIHSISHEINNKNENNDNNILNLSRKEKQIDSDILFFNNYFIMQTSKDLAKVKDAQENIMQSKSIKSKYIYARALFKPLNFQSKFSNYLQGKDYHDDYISESQKEEMLEICETIFKKAAKKGLYEANYFLGLMSLNKNNYNMAYYYFNIAAGYSHSLSFYELYKMIKQEKISVDFTYKCTDNKNKVIIYLI